MSRIKDQINFNTVLLLVIGALITFMIKKADEFNTTIVQLTVRMNVVENDISVIKRKVYQ